MYVKRITIALTVATAIASLWSCKPTEANYKSAYDKTVGQIENTGGIDSTIYAKIRQEARPSTIVVKGDTLPIVTQRATMAPDQDYAQFRRYNIVVGQFKQIFNAKSMCERLYAAGYPNPFILQTREPLYLVVAESCSTTGEALELYKKIVQKPPFAMKEPLPYVLQPAQLAR